MLFSTLRLRQNGSHFADDSFKCILLNENFQSANEISLKFVPKGPINNIPALVQIVACCLAGAKPLSEPMMVRSLIYNYMHICITWPQWVNEFQFSSLFCSVFSITENSIEPLKAQLSELDQAIADQLDLIAAVKSNIIRNDDRMEKMLSTVTQSWSPGF